ncbi:MAG: radical SAM protein [Nevskia sp.]|nr:radical SAM protein [Nevskia sp.]
MLHQIEITTRCNFECFYCAGRNMAQRNMALALFDSIFARIPPGSPVSLQGEGEPFLHPHFWDMVDRLCRGGMVPYTITNATLIDSPQRVAECFPRIGVSLDTLDADLSRQTGRLFPERVLAGLARLREVMQPAQRIVLHTVDFGQPLQALRDYAAANGFRHIVQPLQPKDDYARYYAAESNWGPCNFRCGFVERPLLRYFNVDGVEMPCFYIKDAHLFPGTEAIAAELAARRVPATCRGCREIFPEARVSW